MALTSMGFSKCGSLGARAHQLRQHQARGRDIGGAGDVVHVAGAHQGVDVGFVRLRRHGVAQEDHAIDLALHQLGADLQVAADRAGMLALDREPELVGQAPAGGAGGRERAALEEVKVLAREGDHVVLLLVVCDQCNAWLGHCRHFFSERE